MEAKRSLELSPSTRPEKECLGIWGPLGGSKPSLKRLQKKDIVGRSHTAMFKHLTVVEHKIIWDWLVAVISTHINFALTCHPKLKSECTIDMKQIIKKICISSICSKLFSSHASYVKMPILSDSTAKGFEIQKVSSKIVVEHLYEAFLRIS